MNNWLSTIGSAILGTNSAKNNPQPPSPQPNQADSRARTLQNLLTLGGTFLSAKGQADREDRNNAQNNAQVKAQLNQRNAQFSAELAARLENDRRQQNLAQAVAAMNATKLGENENFATRNRILSQVVPNLRNSNIMPSDPAVAAAMPKLAGPLPANGLPPAVLAAISEKATAHALANRNRQLLNIDPNAPVVDLDAMGFDASATGSIDLAAVRQALIDSRAADEAGVDDVIRRAILQDYQGIQKLPEVDTGNAKKEGFWKTLAKIGSVVAPIVAAPFTGGASLAAIGAGSGASLAALNGSRVKDILLGAAVGSAAGLGAKKQAGAAGAKAKSIGVVPPIGGY